MQTCFISDLHLGKESAQITGCFLDFLRNMMADKKTEALYILGDLFEVWVGNDDNAPWLEEICGELKKLSDHPIKLYIMQGNRDFLLGKLWAEKCGAVLLPDPVLINLYNTPILLTHGDLLCTDDIQYQRWRKVAHCNFLQKIFLSLPLSWRQSIANKLRKKSRQHTQYLSPTKMDVSLSTVEEWIKRYEVTQIIHGHTHRPAVHKTDTYTRYVLPDWHPKGGMLIVESDKSPELVIL